MQKVRVVRRIIPYFIIVALGFVTIAFPIGSGDEFWNYSFARNLAKGMLPYRDFNIVQTPLAAYFPALLMKLFGTRFIILRVAGSILFAAIFCCLFHVCEMIKSDPLNSFLHTILGMTLTFWIYLYNYNHLMLLILLLIYTLTLKEKKTWEHVAIGLLSGIAILVKQNTGLAVMVVNFIICLIRFVRKQDRKTYFIRSMVSIIPGTLFFIYLVISGTLGDFWDYAVYGVTTFKHQYSLIDLLRRNVLVGGFALVFFGCVICVVIKCWKDHENEKARELLLYALAGFSVVYPLCDGAHIVAALIPMIPLFYFYEGKGLRGYVKTAVATVIISSCFFSIFLKTPLGADVQPCTLHNFEGLYIYPKYEEIMKRSIAYVTEKEREGHVIRMADELAIVVDIPRDRYLKNWDMLLVGNIGRNGVEDLLDEEGNLWYMVRQDETELGEQNYFELIHYIKANYRKVDEVMEFEVYEKTN